ncbi:MAG: hypothetical protein WC551_10545 [Patescibacteria group bacterium]
METAKKTMTLSEHQAIHKKLHESLDELLADFITHTQALPSKTTILELIQWSHKETTNPTEKI